MIVVRTELHSAITGEITTLSTVVIDNIGGSPSRGNYRVRAYRKGVDVIETRGRVGLLRESGVEGHARLTSPVMSLVKKALLALKF